MSEATEELAAAVRGVGESLSAAAVSAGQVGESAVELSDEAAGHGWSGVAARMQEVGEALDAAVVSLDAALTSCHGAVTELGLINAENSAEEVAGHLSVSSSRLGEAVTEAVEALEKLEEAQRAAAEVGQEGMQEATASLFDEVTELHERIVAQQATSASEQVQAEAYAQRQSEKLSLGGGGSPSAPSSGSPGPQQWPRGDARANSYGGEGIPDITIPSDPPNPDATPKGYPAKWVASDADETVRGRTRENQSAKLLAELGYDIEQNPYFVGKKPDFRIEGKIFDNFAPSGKKSLRNIFAMIQKKVEDNQTRRAVINLDDSNVTVDQLRRQFADWPVEKLEEVIAIKEGTVHTVFPYSIDGGA